MKVFVTTTIIISLLAAYDITRFKNPAFQNESTYKNYLYYLEKNGLN